MTYLLMFCDLGIIFIISGSVVIYNSLHTSVSPTPIETKTDIQEPTKSKQPSFTSLLNIQTIHYSTKFAPISIQVTFASYNILSKKKWYKNTILIRELNQTSILSLIQNLQELIKQHYSAVDIYLSKDFINYLDNTKQSNDSLYLLQELNDCSKRINIKFYNL